MHSASRNINEKNFPVFKQLIEEVILKSTGEPYTNNRFIAKKLSKSTGDGEWFIPEAKAKEIADSVFASSNHIENNGRRLQTIINKTLNDVPINTWLRTLDSLVEFVWKEEDNHQLEKGKDGESLYWKSYLEKYNRLLLQDIPHNITDIEEDATEAETDTTPHVQSKEKISFEQTPQNKILETENTPAEFESNAASVPHKNQLETKKIIRAGMYGGACAGFFGVMVIVVLRYFTVPIVPTGYENISKDNFFQVFPIIFLFHILGGALLGWMCWRNALHRANIFKSVLLFLVAFLLQIFIRQSTVRNAWRPAGEYTEIENGNPVIRSGGPLGEPDFEALATGLMGAVSFIVLVSALRRRAPKIPSKKETFGIILFAAIPGTGAWCLVYFIFKVLTHFGILREHDFFISKTVFYFVFPHPERVFLVALLCMIYVYCIIASVQYYAFKKGRLSDNLIDVEQEENNQKLFAKDSRSEPISTLPQTSSTKVKRLILYSLLVLFAITFIGYFAFQKAYSNENFIYTESFTNTSEDSLFAKGWFVLNKDSAYWDKRNVKDKSLTLYTLIGDYWVVNSDTSQRYILNNLVLPLPEHIQDYEVEVEIDDFFPNQCCQQAGFIFLKDTSDLADNFRYTIIRNAKDSSYSLGVAFIYSESNGIKYKNGMTGNLIQVDSNYTLYNPFRKYEDIGIKKIWLNVIKKQNQLAFRTKIYRDDRNYQITHTYTTTYTPHFICLAAFQAFPHEFNNYKAVPVIPATFKNFMIKSLSPKE